LDYSAGFFAKDLFVRHQHRRDAGANASPFDIIP